MGQDEERHPDDDDDEKDTPQINHSRNRSRQQIGKSSKIRTQSARPESSDHSIPEVACPRKTNRG
jgi:hypothetical protein